jgi:plastocyanin
MKQLPGIVAAAVAVFVFGAVPAGAVSKPPVDLGQKVNNKGSKDVSSRSKATVEEELDDNYYEPTFIKAKAGEKITFKLENEGDSTHTFTSDELSVDKQLNPGKKAKFTITVPSSAEVFQFHCEFHETLGMRGAVYTRAGASASSSSSSSSSNGENPPATNSSSSSIGYGY